MRAVTDTTLLDKAEAAEKLGTTVRHITDLVHRRKIPFVRLGHRTIRFKPSDLDQWIEDNRTDVVS